MDSALQRLESITDRLEKIITSSLNVSDSQKCDNASKTVEEYEKIINGSLKTFLDLSNTIGAAVQNIGSHVSALLKNELEVIKKSAAFKQPSQEVLKKVLEPLSKEIEKIQTIRQENRQSDLYNHLSAISESIPAFGWFNSPHAPPEFIQEMINSCEFYTNRILKEFKGKGGEHENWIKAWQNVLKDLQAYVKNYYPSGLKWNPHGKELEGASVNASVPDRSALMSQLNKGLGITSQLKKVDKTITENIQSVKSAVLTKLAETHEVTAAPSGARKLELVDLKWKVEYINNEAPVMIKATSIKQSVYIFKCANSTIQIEGKVNTITLDQCTKVDILCTSVVSGFECINSKNIKVQVTDVLPMVSVDKTNGFHLYLTPNYKDTQIFSSLTSEFTVSIPGADGDFVEHPIPQQFQTVFTTTGLKTTAFEPAGC